MLTIDQLRQLHGRTVTGAGGEHLGTVHELYADRTDDDPTFATLTRTRGGLAFVPLAEAVLDGDEVVVPYDASLVETAPAVREDADLSPEDEDALYVHYGLGHPTMLEEDGDAGDVRDLADLADLEATMTRSEERLRVGTRTVEAGRARLRKHVVTEQVSRTLEVSREEAVLEREPITNGDLGSTDRLFQDEVREIVLRAEVPVVEKVAVPVERVRLGVESVTEEIVLTEDLQKEQIDLDRDTGARSDLSR